MKFRIEGFISIPQTGIKRVSLSYIWKMLKLAEALGIRGAGSLLKKLKRVLGHSPAVNIYYLGMSAADPTVQLPCSY